MSAGSRRIGMIGIGMMGHGIATNIVGNGHPPAFLEHPGNQPVGALVAAGARPMTSIAALAAESDIVILCVTGSPEVEDVLLRAGGLLESMRPGTIVIDFKLLHNYVSLGFSAVLAEAAACAERAQVDSGVFLDVLSKGGGDSVVLERLRPYIEAHDITAFRFSIANALKDIGYYTTMAGEIGASRTRRPKESGRLPSRRSLAAAGSRRCPRSSPSWPKTAEPEAAAPGGAAVQAADLPHKAFQRCRRSSDGSFSALNLDTTASHTCSWNSG